jgi:hypothetical protein
MVGMLWKWSALGMVVALAAMLIVVAVQGKRITAAKKVIGELTEWQSNMVSTVKLASGNDKVTTKTAAPQVQAMGNSITLLLQDVEQQNQAIQRLDAQRRAAEARAAQERKARAEAVKRAQNTVAKLEQGALTPAPPEKMEEIMRRAQDLAFEEGL